MTAPRRDCWLPFIGVLLAVIAVFAFVCYQSFTADRARINSLENGYEYLDTQRLYWQIRCERMQKELDCVWPQLKAAIHDSNRQYEALRAKQEATDHKVDRMPGARP